MPNLAVPVLATEVPGNYWTAALYTNNVYNLGTYLLNPPLFKGYQSAAQSIADSTVTALGINTTAIDTYGGHSNVTNNSRYTAMVAGYYLVIANAGFAANASGNRLVEIHQNGGAALNIAQGVGFAPTAANNGVVSTASLSFLNANDYIEAFAYQTSGGALNTFPSQTGMQVIWLHA